MKNLFFYLFSMLLLAGSGCRETTAPPASELEGFKEYFAGEIYLTERARLGGSDSSALPVQLDSLRAQFNISPGGRDSLLRYYRDSLPRWERFLTEVLQRLEDRGRKLRKDRPAFPAGRPAKK